MKQPDLQFALREIARAFGNHRLALVFAIVVVLFALTGPFGTYEALDLPARLGYWLMTLVLTWAIALFAIALCGAFRGESAFDSPVLILVGAALASLPIALAVELIGLAYFGRALTLPGYGWQLLYTLPLSAAFGLLAYLAVQRPGIEYDAAQSGNDGRLIDRLPPEKRGPVLYLTMQDHYVQVVTSKGSELVLLRFSDALQELGGRDGLQIHRSHWVARDAVTGCRRDGEKMLLTMSDGTELPVSRTYRKAVRDLGFETSEASDAD